jgi:TusA-related sulfurtransferase
MSESTNKTDEDFLDITRDVCPMTFVRTKLKLEAMPSGRTLVVRLKGAEPLANVPKAAVEVGHRIEGLSESADGTWLLRIVRA